MKYYYCRLLGDSLRASSPFGGYREKYTRERHARGDAIAGGGEEKASCFYISRENLEQTG